MQSVSAAHAPGHPAVVPLQTSGVHEGRPGVPLVFVQCPFDDAPCAAAQAWQAPVQTASQQNPSTQPPALPHSRHPATLQSDVVLHATLAAFCVWQVPF
jgi:hypothetical protein